MATKDACLGGGCAMGVSAASPGWGPWARRDGNPTGMGHFLLLQPPAPAFGP